MELFPDADLKSVVVTRYNMRRPYRPGDSWLLHRKALFDRYCLPSMRAQTMKDFTWFVLFDQSTPREFTDYIADVAHPIRGATRQEMAEAMREVLAAKNKGPVACVSTRLDNDDALAVDHLAVARSLARSVVNSAEVLGTPHVLNFRSGYELSTETNQLFARNYPASSFFSVVEAPTEPKDLRLASGFHHARIHQSFPTTNIVTIKPMWLIVVHGQNIGNKIKGEKVDAETQGVLRTRFGCS